MAKDESTTSPSTAPEVNPDHVNLDIDQPSTVSDDAELDTSQTIEEAQAAVESSSETDDDAIYKEAATEASATESTPPVDKPKKSKKKFVVALLVLLIIGGGAAAAWCFLLRDKPEPAPVTNTDTTETTQTTIGYEPDTVAYSFRESEDLPDTLFWRPAAGGDRTQVSKLGRGEALTQSDTYGQTVAYATDTTLNISTDGGRTYAKVLDLAAGEQVTSLLVSNAGTNVAVATITENAEKNTVKSVSLDGKTVSELFSVDKLGVFLQAWNEDKKTIVYSDGCYNCDGNTFNLHSINLDSKKVTKLVESINAKEVSNYAVSADATKAVLVQGDVDESADGLGQVTIAPYKVQLLDIASNETTLLTTVGTAGEKNANGTLKYRDIRVGFLAGSVTPYYTDDTALYTVPGDKPNKFYESDKPIADVSFVSETNVIASLGTLEDYALTNFNISDNAGVVIFQGDLNTFLFGVATK